MAYVATATMRTAVQQSSSASISSSNSTSISTPNPSSTSVTTSAAMAGDGSRTMTITVPLSEEERSGAEEDVVGAIRLRGAAGRSRAAGQRRRVVAWGEDVIDNEGCGRKSSKVCCIYHKPRRFDESSSSSSDDESDSDVDSDADPECHHHHPASLSSGPSGGRVGPRRAKNAYEHVPSSSRRKGKGKQEGDP
ncbi:hypothetical protein AMATHDRAFT_66049 [Amanita thiersii Skay4041]|uniref:Type 1 phosphatases regulator n=1 Tax=Amanita thiersii Skay4041 TaxID=703135 RepID=A0A2A9NIY9_9AGAR|nr:hypothetical protein AMATHDRAFT_66049 [Amanita thiersii Skay4041]